MKKNLNIEIIQKSVIEVNSKVQFTMNLALNHDEKKRRWRVERSKEDEEGADFWMLFYKSLQVLAETIRVTSLIAQKKYNSFFCQHKILAFLDSLIFHSASGPLPCFPSLQFIITQSWATGIADHILPLGDLLGLKSTLLGLKSTLSGLTSAL